MKKSTDITFGLWQLINRTRHLLYKIRKKEITKVGITLHSSAVLLTIQILGDQATLKNIAQQLFLEHHSIREQLIRMEKEGLVTQTKDLERKNMKRVTITEKGNELCQLAKKRQSTKSIMSALTEEEQVELWYLMSKIRARAMKKLGMKNVIPFPPSDIEEYISE